MKPDPRRWRRTDVEAAIAMYVGGWSLFTIGSVLKRSWIEVQDLLTRPAIDAKVRALRE